MIVTKKPRAKRQVSTIYVDEYLYGRDGFRRSVGTFWLSLSWSFQRTGSGSEIIIRSSPMLVPGSGQCHSV